MSTSLEFHSMVVLGHFGLFEHGFEALANTSMAAGATHSFELCIPPRNHYYQTGKLNEYFDGVVGII